MQDAEDIALQRAILASPDDTTLKLVYADWLQDRADPRAEFVRLQVKLGGMLDPASGAQAAGVLSTLGEGLDPVWVAFMTTLAQPFAPIRFQDGEPGHPFTEPVGAPRASRDVCVPVPRRRRLERRTARGPRVPGGYAMGSE